ncbi:ABC transporter ATP-binding protein [Thermoanaerobacterium saccharolyticum]|jgi:putative ABC transport system ATP-binding protein|uniref:Putative bacteriocin export ABC transporter, lactococcin 972 group n=1 Tax=Thermoanaerobacterium thermosaccharolyticum M0795 TaxID=698948 RepID=L0IM52_THETR|nr:ABC transporter ATP-binding protein [Thermoanaerobacterium thermosaccharolyticum]AGB19938.1 putative bacteriocin export ABC transporter, lactococcin 972 group [Thermoanaerobacterium thermosaccharolyticum M0795]MBE0069981.1 ABC transporter ATP-binding protein [Thermoanaerobacterium thermosaccharolyticum]MBE0229535.1 ABC transporter ATP-binding protein [Thermoanaerobacterium thermosaccharolyticum]
MKNVCELIDITKAYGDHVVLNHMNLNVQEKEMVAITGRSGSGKTTILNIIGLLERPTSGTIKLFDEVNPQIGSGKAIRILRTKVSYLFQNYALIDNETIGYNLEIPLIYSKKTKKEKEKLKIDALKKVGLDIPLKKKIYELSGGEQQRVAIARILLKPCELILADEPTGSLDADNRDEIMKILKNLNEEGKTIIIVTHDKHVTNVCSRTVNL